MTEGEFNAALKYGSAGLRIASIFFPVLAPLAGLASTVSGVLPEVEDAAQKIEASIKSNGGTILPAHIAAAQGLLSGDWTFTPTE